MKSVQNLISYLVAAKSCRGSESALSGAMGRCLTYKLVYLNVAMALEQKCHCSLNPTPGKETVSGGTGRTDTSQILFICSAGTNRARGSKLLF